MSYTPHTLVAFGGKQKAVVSGDEIWECTIRLGTPADFSASPMSDADCEEYLGLIATPLGTWFSAANTKVPATTTLEYVKCNPIGADGKYSSTTSHTHVYSTPAVGGFSGAGMPSFCSICYSWRTTRTRGLASHGRMFMPNSGFAMSPAGSATVSTTDQSTTATQAAALISLLRRTLTDGGAWKPTVFSNQGPVAEITSVLVGNVADVQRRRKDQVRETYVANVFGP